jgi:outer membrane protein
MNKTTALILWNVVLTGLVAWLCFRTPGSTATTATTAANDSTRSAASEPLDTAVLRNARIAYFIMDSIQNNYDLVQESRDRVRSEGQRLEGNLMKEMEKAEARARELAGKDHTYSTKAEVEADEREFQQLQMRIQEMRASSQDKLDELQVRMLQDITKEIQDYLTEYNKGAAHDYIFSIQDEGQIWVGNPGLDITRAVVDGLNDRHRARKAGK